MNPALTTSGKTRTATAFDLHLAAAGFWATSCCRARRQSLVKSSAEAVRMLSNATVTSIRPAAYFHFDVIFILVLFRESVFLSSEGDRLSRYILRTLFILAVRSRDRSRLRPGRWIKQRQSEAHAP